MLVIQSRKKHSVFTSRALLIECKL